MSNTYQDIPYVTRKDLTLEDLDEAIRLTILVKNIEIWMKNRGLDAKEYQLTQTAKLVSEVAELCEHAAKGEDVLDDAGDVMVVAIGAALRNGNTTVDALEKAFTDIKDRKGHMINGIFVKEKDLNGIPEQGVKLVAPKPEWVVPTVANTVEGSTVKCIADGLIQRVERISRTYGFNVVVEFKSYHCTWEWFKANYLIKAH